MSEEMLRRAEGIVECSCGVRRDPPAAVEHWRKCPVTVVAQAIEEAEGEALERAAREADDGPMRAECLCGALSQHRRYIAREIRSLKTKRREPSDE